MAEKAEVTEPFDVEPPTFRMEPVPGRPGVVRPVLNKRIWSDPETGAASWDNGPAAEVNDG